LIIADAGDIINRLDSEDMVKVVFEPAAIDRPEYKQAVDVKHDPGTISDDGV